jgi:adenosylcobyric acid synthase
MHRRRPSPDQLDIVVVRLPRISNYDDVEPFEHEAGVVVRFVERGDAVDGADLVVVPGSKNTATDLAWLRSSGISEIIEGRAERGEPVLGICGGYQMLGEVIEDPLGVESADARITGLGLLPIRTRFEHTKVTAQIRAKIHSDCFLTAGQPRTAEVLGYEIHMGTVEQTRPCPAPFEIRMRSGTDARIVDGGIGFGGAVVGTMIHGLFENEAVRKSVLAFLRRRKGLPEPTTSRPVPTRQAEYDRLEAVVRESLDHDLLWQIVGLPQRDHG